MNTSKLIYKILRYTNIHLIFRYFFQKNNVTILMFHKPSFDSFEFCIKYFQSYYNIISLEDYLNFRNGKKEIPDYSIVITMDDGHKSNYQLLPVIKKYNFKPTIFLTSGVINTNRHIWTQHLVKITSPNSAIKMKHDELLKILKDNKFDFENEYNQREYLNLEEINEMNDCVDFQSHTVFHNSLPFCSDVVSYEEINKSKNDLEKLLNKKINAIAFPFGLYSEREIEYVKQAGYDIALTVDFGYNNKNTDLYRLKRISVNDTNDINELIVKSSGVWAFLKTFFGLRKPLYINR